MDEWRYKARQLEGVVQGGGAVINAAVVGCPTGWELEILSVRWNFTADATVGNRQFLVTIGESDALASSYLVCPLVAIAAGATLNAVASVGVNDQSNTIAPVTYLKCEIPRIRFVEKDAFVSLAVTAVGAGDITSAREIRYRFRPRPTETVPR